MTELLVEPQWLASHLSDPDLRIVDLCKAEHFAKHHVPGAVHLAYEKLVAKAPPVGGLLPDRDDFAALVSGLGISNGQRIIAYDEEGGGRAARLIWSLHAYGHRQVSLLNGGATAWLNEGFPLEDTVMERPGSTFDATLDDSVIADFTYVSRALNQSQCALLDARSLEEYTGARRNAEHGGHIPGARRLEWTDLMDRSRNLRLKLPAEIHAQLQTLGIDPAQEVIVYCQTHHRSALNYVALKWLGFERVRGYPGSWSDWGNRADAPVASGEEPG
ncbi:MAG: sulfurtransferase [Gammaproteobacteria bacterium]|nr:sulfurtransferase [Gammaproteobacteria bacterium]